MDGEVERARELLRRLDDYEMGEGPTAKDFQRVVFYVPGILDRLDRLARQRDALLEALETFCAAYEDLRGYTAAYQQARRAIASVKAASK